MLVERNNSVVIIEHNLDVIKCADYVIDLGPEAGEKGGEVVAIGTPEEIVDIENSWTGKYLKEYWMADKRFDNSLCLCVSVVKMNIFFYHRGTENIE